MAATSGARDAASVRLITRRTDRESRTAAALKVLALFATGLLSSAPATGAAWDPIPPSAWLEQARPDSGGGDAIMLLDRSVCTRKSDGFHAEYFARAKVFTAEGRDIGNVEVEYIRDHWKLRDLRGRSVSPAGRVTELDPSQIITSTVLRFGDFEIMRASATIPGIEPGSIVEWSYTLDGESWEYGSWRFRFANRFYTCVSSHTWRPSQWDDESVRKAWQYYGIHSAFVEETSVPNREHPQVVTFTVRNQPGVRDEELAPPAEEAIPNVLVYYVSINQTTTAYWSAWKHTIDQYQQVFAERARSLDRALEEIRQRHPEPESALVATFRWIQGRLHSVSELPAERQPDRAKIERSYQFADNAEQLLGRSEANPVEINSLMALAAQRLGFESFLGLVGDRRYESFDYTVMGFPPSNPITVVKLAGHWVFLQPDSRFESFGSIPWYLRGGYCLVSGQGRELFVRVPPEAGNRATALWNLEVNLDRDGVMDGRVEAHLGGEEARRWRRRLWDEVPASRTGLLRKWLAEDAGPTADFEAPTIESPPDSEFVLRASAHWPNVSSVAGERITVPASQLIPWRTHARLRADRRRQTLLFENARTEMFRLRIQMPEGMNVEHLPDPQQFQNKLGSWSERWSRDGAALVVERRLDLERAELPAQSYELARELFRSLDTADQTVLLVTRTP
jgi:hypothetical protein